MGLSGEMVFVEREVARSAETSRPERGAVWSRLRLRPRSLGGTNR